MNKDSESGREVNRTKPEIGETLEIKSGSILPSLAARGTRALRGGVSSLQPAVLIYCGLLISMLGILPLLAIFGTFDNGPVEPLAIPFGLLFAVVFGGGGGLILYIGLCNAMNERLGRSRPFFTGLLRLVWLRANRKTLYAAAPDFLLAALILWLIADPDGLGWLEPGDLQSLVLLEFFAIHSTAFLGIIAFIRWTGWGGLASVLQAVLFLGFLGLYVALAYWATGFTGAFSFAVLTLSKYVGYAVRPLSLDSKGKLVLRWFTGLLIFITVVGFFDVDIEAPDNLAFAATYFIILGLFETFDLMAPRAQDYE